MGTAGDDPKVSEAKIQGDVDFAWVPRQIEGDGRERNLLSKPHAVLRYGALSERYRF